MADLERHLVISDLKKSEILLHQGDHQMEQYFVLDGILKRIVSSADAKEMILRFAIALPMVIMLGHFNGGWLKTAVIPADRATDGAFITLRIQSEARVREIIESAAGSDEATKISNIYASFMAADAVNAKGHAPIAGELSEVDSITSLKDFISTLATTMPFDSMFPW